MWQLIKLEKWTMVKGWLVSTLIVFPFTFLPVLFKDGPLLDRVFGRVSESALYSVLFALAVVLSAVYQNYTRQAKKLKLFDTTAINSLNFEVRTEGYKSLFDDLNVYLFGFHNDVGYRLDIRIDLEAYDNDYLILQPIVIKNGDVEVQLLMKEHGEVLRRSLRLAKGQRQEVMVNLQEINLMDSNGIRKFMSIINADLKSVAG